MAEQYESIQLAKQYVKHYVYVCMYICTATYVHTYIPPVLCVVTACVQLQISPNIIWSGLQNEML